jgi:hypothetical protein
VLELPLDVHGPEAAFVQAHDWLHDDSWTLIVGPSSFAPMAGVRRPADLSPTLRKMAERTMLLAQGPRRRVKRGVLTPPRALVLAGAAGSVNGRHP